VVDDVSQIYRLNLTTMQRTKLSDGKGNDRNPTYAHDGSKIAFYSFRNSLNSVLYVMNADGSAVTPVSDPTLSAVNQSWSPDNTLIAYQGQNGPDVAIYVYQFSTKQTRRVTDTHSVNYAPTWYCNSNTLVFNSDVTGNPNLFLTQALPIDAAAIRVDKQAQNLTSLKNAAAQFAEDSPHEENASNLGPPVANLILPSLGGNNVQCGAVTDLSVAGGSLAFPVINTNSCASATPTSTGTP
jgi:Tol biopolymer transport system component